MYYDLIVVKRKLNKKKIAILIIIILFILVLTIFFAIKYANYAYDKKIAEEKARLEQEEIARQIEEEKRIEAQRIAEEEERKRINLAFFTEEQMQAIENIYESDEKRVFLTFDDGPTTQVTPFILDLLKEENIKATFFVLGNRVKANPELIKREYEEGHYIANHGYSHKYSQIYANPQNVIEEYNYTEGCIQEALEISEYHSKVFRFPGGSVGGYYRKIKNTAKQMLKEQGIVYLDWNALSNDADGAHTREMIMDNIIRTVGEKQSVVVLMHDASDKILTYDTLPEVIQFFRDNGYTFMNLYDIL